MQSSSLPLELFSDLFPIFLISLFFVFMYIIFNTQKKHFKKITTELNGTYSLTGSLKFQYKNFEFRLTRIGTQNMNTGSGGAYPSVYLKVPQGIDFFLGPKESYKYIAIGSLKKEYEMLTIKCENSLREFILKSDSLKNTQKMIEVINRDQLLQAEIDQLLKRDFQYIRSIDRLELVGFSIKRNYYINFSFISHEVFNNPDLMRTELDKLLSILDKLTNLPSPLA